MPAQSVGAARDSRPYCSSITRHFARCRLKPIPDLGHDLVVERAVRLLSDRIRSIFSQNNVQL